MVFVLVCVFGGGVCGEDSSVCACACVPVHPRDCVAVISEEKALLMLCIGSGASRRVLGEGRERSRDPRAGGSSSLYGVLMQGREQHGMGDAHLRQLGCVHTEGSRAGSTGVRGGELDGEWVEALFRALKHAPEGCVRVCLEDPRQVASQFCVGIKKLCGGNSVCMCVCVCVCACL